MSRPAPGMDGGTDGRMDGRMDGGMETVIKKNGPRKTVTEGGRDDHGRWTGWSRKVDGMVTEAGRDGLGKWSKTKDLLYYMNLFF